MCYYYLCNAICECSNCDPDGIYWSLRWETCRVDCPQSFDDLEF